MNTDTVIFIGADVGRHIGLAVWIPDTKQLDIRTYNDDPDAALQHILDHCGMYQRVIVTVEDPSLNRPVFFRPGTSVCAMRKIAQNVGMVKESTRDFMWHLRSRGIHVERVAPRRGARGVSAKVSAEDFRRITGYVGRTSQHARDAAMLVYGRTSYEGIIAIHVAQVQEEMRFPKNNIIPRRNT